MVAQEGQRVGTATVRSIRPGEVVLADPDGVWVVRLNAGAGGPGAVEAPRSAIRHSQLEDDQHPE